MSSPGRGHLILLAAIAAACVCAVVAYELAGAFVSENNAAQRGSSSIPITHYPTYLGEYSFILGSGNVIQNGLAYSYVVLNATELSNGNSFTGYPALDVPLGGKSIGQQDNFTVEVTFVGSAFGRNPYWINFSVAIPSLGFLANSSQMGIEGTFARSAWPLSSAHREVLFFSQVSNVVNEFDEFEYFFYVGNSNTPAPNLTHGPPH